jgi:hypothetical protein
VAKKYAVRVEGTGWRAPVRQPSETVSPTTGFSATRFVEALNEADAMKLVLSLVRGELAQFDLDGSETCRLTVDEVREDPAAFDRFAPGEGFTWF